MAYKPPKELQSLPIWTLVIANSRDEKVPEYYYTKKQQPLLTWPKLQQRYRENKAKFAPVTGIICKDLFVIDIDKQQTIPDNLQRLIEKHPTHFHESKSGNGAHIYYRLNSTTDQLHKKYCEFNDGQLYNGAFVSTTDKALSDFSEETVAKITIDELLEFMPEVKRFTSKYRSQDHKEVLANPSGQYVDVDKMLADAKGLLNRIPTDVDSLLEIAYEIKFKEISCNSYTHWLLISHALTHLSIELDKSGGDTYSTLEQMFLGWSKNGLSFKDEDDCIERFKRSHEETIASLNNGNKAVVTLNSLRKLSWAYKIPVNDFPYLSYNSKGEMTGVDKTDPRNYEFIIDLLELKVLRDQISDEIYVQGPKSIISHYFSVDKKSDSYFTKDNDDISVPYNPKYERDKDFMNALVSLFRDFGIKSCTPANPLTAGFTKVKEIIIDPIYTWMTAVPWDKKERVVDLITDTIVLDNTKVPSIIPKDFLHSLIIKQLQITAGLRAKLARFRDKKPNLTDRYIKPQAILILHGYQNAYKSTWIECLMPSETNAIISVPPSNIKDTLEIQRAISKAFILNIDEIDVTFEKMDHGDLKNVVTQEKDSYRQMYSEAFKPKMRAASFFGTTNQQQVRLDRTGNRRWWFIPVELCNATPLIQCNYQQVWAEILYRAENMDIKEWSITGQERDWVNLIASQYSKSTKAEKALELIYDDEMLDHTEINFDDFFNVHLTQGLKRKLVKTGVLVPIKGNKAYTAAKNAGFMKDVTFDLASFEYAAQDFIGSLTNIRNKVLKGKKWSFREGRLTYQEGNNPQTTYFFFPFKATIVSLIQAGEIPIEVLYKTEVLDS